MTTIIACGIVVPTMTEKQKTVVAYLKIADIWLRQAMVASGRAKMPLVTCDIRESEWHLDEALAHMESYAKAVAKKKSKKNLTSARGCVKVGA